MKHYIKPMISGIEIKNRVRELGKEITNNYKNSKSKIILIGLLRGSFIFIADLCRYIKVHHEVDFITTSSYGNNTFSNLNVKILTNLNENIYKKNVVIVEDIIDSGYTLQKVLKILKLKKPKSISICTLLNKVQRRKIDLTIDYIGFSISNYFVVGYGIDYAQNYRYLPYIGKVIFF